MSRLMHPVAQFTVLGTLGLLCGASIAWNVGLYGQVRDLPELQARQAVATSLEGIRRSGHVEKNDPEARTLVIRYEAESGSGEKLLKVTLTGDTQVQRIKATVEDGVIVTARSVQIDQAALVEGEPVHVVAAPTRAGEVLRATTVVVGDVLPRR